MKVEIWSDVICPWCGIGQHRLNEALAAFSHRDQVEVVHRSFELDPRAPVGEARPVRESLKAKYGLTDARFEAMTAHVESVAAQDGLRPYIVGENRTGNTRLAHELLAYATDHGREDDAWARLYRAYFGEARSIFDVDALVALGAEIGLDADDLREALTTGRYTGRVRADEREAQQLGASGVPFVVIDRKYAVSGAQPVEVFRGALERAWSERAPVVLQADDATCGPDGCALPDLDDHTP